jgi:phosphate transport system substrate-binding protein
MKNQVLKIRSLSLAVLATAAITLTSCKGGKADSANSANNQTDASNIIGAGSSFDNPLFSKMFAQYNDSTKIRINYQSVGSGAGISQLTNKTVDFGASDAPMKDEQIAAAKAPVLHIPITAGAVVVSYNLPEVKANLKFSPETLADIFLGKITKWNDAKIAADNTGVNLPSTAIVIAHRSDGSGTSAIFTGYLAKVNPEWSTKVGSGTSVNWPIGLGGKGNEGVSGLIKQTPGGIGYIELAYAVQNQMPYAQIKNKSGKFITPTIASVTSAANVTIPADGKILLTDTDAADGYPISGFSWVLLYKEQSYNNRTQKQAEDLINLVNWMIHGGQKFSAALNYAPLSPTAVKTGEAILKSATFNGKEILK